MQRDRPEPQAVHAVRITQQRLPEQRLAGLQRLFKPPDVAGIFVGIAEGMADEIAAEYERPGDQYDHAQIKQSRSQNL